MREIALCVVNKEHCEVLLRVHDARLFDSLAELERFLIESFICFLLSGTVHGQILRTVDEDGNIHEEQFSPFYDDNEYMTISPQWLRYYLEDRMSPYCLVASIADDKFFYILHTPFDSEPPEKRCAQERYLEGLYHSYFDYILICMKENLPILQFSANYENYTIRFKPVCRDKNQTAKPPRPSIS